MEVAGTCWHVSLKWSQVILIPFFLLLEKHGSIKLIEARDCSPVVI